MPQAAKPISRARSLMRLDISADNMKNDKRQKSAACATLFCYSVFFLAAGRRRGVRGAFWAVRRLPFGLASELSLLAAAAVSCAASGEETASPALTASVTSAGAGDSATESAESSVFAFLGDFSVS